MGTNITNNPNYNPNNNNHWYVVEYMDGSIHQTLIHASSVEEASVPFKQIIRVVSYSQNI